MRQAVLALALVGLLGVAVNSAAGEEGAVTTTPSYAADQAVVTPVWGFGVQTYPRWYGTYYYPSSPGFSYGYYPGYESYYGTPGYQSYYYPGPSYYYTYPRWAARPYVWGPRRWW
jgi:hypothetical protein